VKVTAIMTALIVVLPNALGLGNRAHASAVRHGLFAVCAGWDSCVSRAAARLRAQKPLRAAAVSEAAPITIVRG